MQYSVKSLTWRRAAEQDAKLYFDWANDLLVRANSHNQNPIPWKDHLEWFSSRLNSGSIMMVFQDGETPVGQVRVDPDGLRGVIDFSVAAQYRGRNAGTMMLLHTVEFLTKDGRLSALIAEVKADNVASATAFRKAGFRLISTHKTNDVTCHEFEYSI